MPFQEGNKHGNRFQSGESGNPGGRPKGAGITDVFLRILAMENPEEFKPGSGAELLAWRLYKTALEGEGRDMLCMSAMKIALERADGKVPDRLEIESAPPSFEFVTVPNRKHVEDAPADDE